MNKKRIIIIVSIVVLVLGGAVTIPYFFISSDSNKSTEQTAEPGTVSEKTASDIGQVAKQWRVSQEKDQAISALDAALAKAETPADKQFIKGFKYKVYAEAGDTSAALSVSKELAEADNSALSYDRLAQAYAANGDNKAALENYKLARQLVEASNVPDKQMELDYYDASIKDLESKVQ